MAKISILILFLTFTVTHIGAEAQQRVQGDITDGSSRINVESVDSIYKSLYAGREFLREKKIIAVGESTHGTKEFFELRLAIIKFCVNELGFRTVALEASFSEAELLNDFLSNVDKGQSTELLKGLYYWIWQTQEMSDIINWIRSYNMDKDPGDQVRITGVDMSFSKGAATILSEYLQSQVPEIYSDYKDVLTMLQKEDPVYFSQLPESDKVVIYRRILELRNIFDVKFEADKAFGESDEAKRILQHLTALGQFLEFNMQSEDNQPRDLYMAKNTRWLADNFPSNGVVLLAHNDHIANVESTAGFIPMGHYLKQWFGDQYYSICLDFNKGKFNAMNNGLQAFEVGPAKKGSSGYEFSKSNQSPFFIDVKNATISDEPVSFLNRNIEMRSIGAVFYPASEGKHYIKTRISDAFDGLIFVNETSAATPLPTEEVKSAHIPFMVVPRNIRGNNFVFSADIFGPKLDVVEAELYMVFSGNKGKILSRKRVEVTNRSGEWESYKIEGVIDEHAKMVTFGISIRDVDELYIDNIHFYVLDGEKRKSILEYSFDNLELGDDPPFQTVGKHFYSFEIVSKPSDIGSRCLKVNLFNK